MTAFYLGPPEREAIARIVEFSTRPENVYDPGPDVPDPPMAGHCITLGNYRVNFTISRGARAGEPMLFRHLSIANWPRRDGHLPSLFAVDDAAQAFGFGPRSGWTVGACDCGCLAYNVLEPYEVPA